MLFVLALTSLPTFALVTLVLLCGLLLLRGAQMLFQNPSVDIAPRTQLFIDVAHTDIRCRSWTFPRVIGL